MLFNQIDGKSHSKLMVYDVVVKELKYEDKDEK